MALAGSILDYEGGAGDRNLTIYIQVEFSGSYTVGGDTLDLTALGNSNGLEVEGPFELPLTLGPGVFLENLAGYYVQPVISVNNSGAATEGPLNALLLQVFAPGGSELTAGSYPASVSDGTLILALKQRRV